MRPQTPVQVFSPLHIIAVASAFRRSRHSLDSDLKVTSMALRLMRRKSLPLFCALLIHCFLRSLRGEPSFVAPSKPGTPAPQCHRCPDRAFCPKKWRATYGVSTSKASSLHAALGLCLLGSVKLARYIPQRSMSRLASLCMSMGALPSVLQTHEEQTICRAF